ncbi:Meiotic Sister-Chromatid recombination aldehyde dehydrogenase [Ascochyta clinopodiicola]|nr:Meiotic Sister-Chromatid recombination aldehyde dehydrogenase [Ascochyta clinopodiicola]
MEHVNEYSGYVLGAVGAATLYFLYLLLRTDVEAPVPYSIAPPEQAQPGWRGVALQEPSLKKASTAPSPKQRRLR